MSSSELFDDSKAHWLPQWTKKLRNTTQLSLYYVDWPFLVSLTPTHDLLTPKFMMYVCMYVVVRERTDEERKRTTKNNNNNNNNKPKPKSQLIVTFGTVRVLVKVLFIINIHTYMSLYEMWTSHEFGRSDGDVDVDVGSVCCRRLRFDEHKQPLGKGKKRRHWRLRHRTVFVSANDKKKKPQHSCFFYWCRLELDWPRGWSVVLYGVACTDRRTGWQGGLWLRNATTSADDEMKWIATKAIHCAPRSHGVVSFRHQTWCFSGEHSQRRPSWGDPSSIGRIWRWISDLGW